MLTPFWSSISGKLADRFVALSAPALVFWLGGLLAWSYGHGGIHELTRPATWLGQKSAFTQAVVLVVILAGVAASGLVVSRITMPVLRLLEGYWPVRPARLTRIRNALITGLQEKAATQDADWQAQAPHVLPPAMPTPEQLARFARLSRAMRRRPLAPYLFMPTRLGNLLRAAETRPFVKYGLDSVVVWPRLWLVLPDTTRQELAAARAALDSAVAASIWGVLFCAFAPWTPYAVPVGLAVAAVAITIWLPARAEVFGDLVEAAYDMHRTALYQQLRWPLPTDPASEQVQGRLITAYLQLGSDDPAPTFTLPG
ncbi:MAG: hypothetical protein ACLQK8_04735 [Streptosporangiaceae bacterium]|jgi:hypothetical protein